MDKKMHKIILKIIPTISFLIIAVSIAYYFIFYLPSNKNTQLIYENNKRILQNNKECGDRGKKLHKDLSEENPNSSYINAEFYYNEKLNKCLYYSGSIKADSFQKWIIDVDTNETIVLFLEVNKKVITGSYCQTCLTNDEFEVKYKSLFNK